jgi:hypothetical protein
VCFFIVVWGIFLTVQEWCIYIICIFCIVVMIIIVINHDYHDSQHLSSL